MRLLILAPEFGATGGGIATFYRNLAPALEDLAVEVRVLEGNAFHTGSRSPRRVGRLSAELLEHDRLRKWWDRFPAFAAVPGLRSHLAAAWAMWEQADFGAGADVVEVADWGLLFAPPVLEARTPVIVQGHGSVGQIGVHDPVEGEEAQSALERLIESAVLAAGTRLQTYSRANADFWRSETGANVEMIRPALAIPETAPRPAPSNRGLVIGRIQRWKGPDVLCEALQLLGDGAPGVDWVGRDTTFGRRGTSTAQDLGRRFSDVWGTRLTPCVPVSPDKVRQAQAGALFNIVPSRWDVFNFTAAEAMASGRPTIVSTGAGASELVVDGENGFVFPAGDASALAGVIERILASSPTRLEDIGGAGRDTIRRELDPGIIAASRMAAYQSAIDAFNAGPPAPVRGWLGEICRPDAAGPADGAFLDRVPSRTLAAQLVQRVRAKLGSTLSKASGRL